MPRNAGKVKVHVSKILPRLRDLLELFKMVCGDMECCTRDLLKPQVVNELDVNFKMLQGTRTFKQPNCKTLIVAQGG
jgi:hypothetical protein